VLVQHTVCLSSTRCACPAQGVLPAHGTNVVKHSTWRRAARKLLCMVPARRGTADSCVAGGQTQQTVSKRQRQICWPSMVCYQHMEPCSQTKHIAGSSQPESKATTSHFWTVPARQATSAALSQGSRELCTPQMLCTTGSKRQRQVCSPST
jgi:hypothetical protein